jgi:hypothetical protein
MTVVAPVHYGQIKKFLASAARYRVRPGPHALAVRKHENTDPSRYEGYASARSDKMFYYSTMLTILTLWHTKYPGRQELRASLLVLPA